ncbi:nitrite reductase [Paenibacillus mesophilus]|uniref:nitrite reductase n=1 Tax=Paenibacillus mesophilus TaxID=2582849 RepID=UPI001EE3D850|nr:nitrite reductase [Paenibacillus mesophilus]
MKIAVAPAIGAGGSLFSADQWKAIGEALGKEAKVEFTSFKQLYVDIEVERADEVKNALLAAGLEIYPVGFFTKNLIACNFCRGAEEAGLAIALQLNEAVAGQEVPSPLKVGYAGCANATSEPLFQHIGVVKMKNGFDIYVGGEGKSIKASVGLLMLEDVPENAVVAVVQRLIAVYKENARKKERFSRFVQRITLERLRELVSTE